MYVLFLEAFIVHLMFFFITQSLQCLVEEAAMAMAYPKDSAINLPWEKTIGCPDQGIISSGWGYPAIPGYIPGYVDISR